MINSSDKGKLGETITEGIIERYKSFCKCWRQPGSGNRKNKKYKNDFYLRLEFDDDLKYEFKLENKNWEKIGIFRWWDILLTKLLPNHIPAITCRENYSDTLISMRLKDWLSILEDLYRRMEKIKSENTIVNYDDKRAVREIKYNAQRILQEIKKL